MTEFVPLLVENGIRYLSSASCCPEGNGKVEAFIKTIEKSDQKQKNISIRYSSVENALPCDAGSDKEMDNEDKSLE